MRHFGKDHRHPGARPAAGRRPPERCGVCRPVAHWQDGALQPRQLRGCVGCRAGTVRLGARWPASAATRPKFSFNNGDGRCPTCRGIGLRACGDAVPQRCLPALPGLRRQALPPEILEITIERGARRLNVADVLDLTVSEAVALLQATAMCCALQPIVDVGLEYVKARPAHYLVGRRGPAPQAGRFSGRGGARSPGRARRWRARARCFCSTGPTTGLHFDDIAS